MSLDVPSKKFQQWIEQTGKLITDFYQENKEAKVFAGKSPGEVQKLLEEPLPADPGEIEDLLDEVSDKILSTITNSV